MNSQKTTKIILLATMVVSALAANVRADAEMLQILLSSTPCKLHRAIIKGQRSTTKNLIENARISPNQPCMQTDGSTHPVSPLVIAVMADRPAFIRYLVRKGANIQVGMGGMTLLHIAASFSKDGKAIQELINLGLSAEASQDLLKFDDGLPRAHNGRGTSVINRKGEDHHE